MRLWLIYIFPQSVCLVCWRKYVDWSWDYINRSQTHECGNWGWGHAIPRIGIHKWDFRCSVGRLGRHCTSTYTGVTSLRQRVMTSDNNQHAFFDGSWYKMCIKNLDPLLNHRAVGISALRPLSLGNFSLPETMVFPPFYGISFPIFSWTAHCISYLKILPDSLHV